MLKWAREKMIGGERRVNSKAVGRERHRKKLKR
jgi:hypothetical protein